MRRSACVARSRVWGVVEGVGRPQEKSNALLCLNHQTHIKDDKAGGSLGPRQNRMINMYTI